MSRVAVDITEAGTNVPFLLPVTVPLLPLLILPEVPALPRPPAPPPLPPLMFSLLPA